MKKISSLFLVAIIGTVLFAIGALADCECTCLGTTGNSGDEFTVSGKFKDEASCDVKCKKSKDPNNKKGGFSSGAFECAEHGKNEPLEDAVAVKSNPPCREREQAMTSRSDRPLAEIIGVKNRRHIII